MPKVFTASRMSGRIWRRVLLAAGILCLFLSTLLPAQSPQSDGSIKVFSIDGAIGPATSEYLRQGFSAAQTDGTRLIIITMDTPGGLDNAMRDIIQEILDSDIPVVSYVSPQGARAASAGTYILYASHIAAMAPATNLGAATPVQVGMPSLGEDGDSEEPIGGGTAMERKMINDARAYIRGLAVRNGRNAEWAETAVVEAASLSASEALADNVITLVAEDMDDLLLQLDGMEVTVKGRPYRLQTAGMEPEYQLPDWRLQFLSVITDPSLILILGMIGVYGLIIEFYNPGFGFAGTVGVICLLLAGYGLQLLPLNFTGLGLVILGVILMIAEALVPSFGIMGIGGIVAFSIGAVILVDSETGVYRVSLPLIAAVATAFALLLAFSLRIFMRIRHKGVVSGLTSMIGEAGESVSDFDEEGMVKVHGELWTATTSMALRKGDKIKVLGIDGSHLIVGKLSAD